MLVEAPDAAEAWACRRVLERDGYEVAVCPGPGSGLVPCPVLEGRDCPAAQGADVVFSLLSLSDEPSRRILHTLRTTQAETPIVIEVTPEERGRHPDLIGQTKALDVPVRGAELSRAIKDALASR